VASTLLRLIFASHKNIVNTLIEHTFRDTVFTIRRSPSWQTTTLKVMAMASKPAT
jgi:hypothetical protein